MLFTVQSVLQGTVSTTFQPPLIYGITIYHHYNLQTMINAQTVLEYYGDMTLDILKDALLNYPDALGFTFWGKEFGNTEQEMQRLLNYWHGEA